MLIIGIVYITEAKIILDKKTVIIPLFSVELIYYRHSDLLAIDQRTL